jgi:hypothetical protein
MVREANSNIGCYTYPRSYTRVQIGRQGLREEVPCACEPGQHLGVPSLVFLPLLLTMISGMHLLYLLTEPHAPSSPSAPPQPLHTSIIEGFMLLEHPLHAGRVWVLSFATRPPPVSQTPFSRVAQEETVVCSSECPDLEDQGTPTP